MKMTHLLAMHGHFAGSLGGMLLILLILAALLLLVCWPDKSQTK